MRYDWCMNLLDPVNHSQPQPWSEGDNIPWNEPECSQAMLHWHLNQDTDAAHYQAYTDLGYQALLAECGFNSILFFPALTGDVQPADDLFVLLAKR
jgi:hypothetical protein